MQEKLKNWAVIDIETTGLSPVQDEMIDIGWIQFEGTKKVKEFQSLIRTDIPLSKTIQKLTGIDQKMMRKAPLWTEVERELHELDCHTLVAHNSSFEESFLNPTFEGNYLEGVEYADSLAYLGLLFPGTARLKLEGFNRAWGIREGENHRGFDDSMDLIKVMIISGLLIKREPSRALWLGQAFERFSMNDWWFYHFFNLETLELKALADEIEFEVNEPLDKAIGWWDEIRSTGQGTKYNADLSKAYSFSGEGIKDFYQKEMKDSEELRYRSSQEELSLRVGQSFKNNIHSIIQAPTGTGKTIGYLLSAALFNREEGKQVLISTGTKTLQEQALKQDVPKVKELLGLGEEFSVKKLIGSNNHLCELSYSKEKDDLFVVSDILENKLAHLYMEHLYFLNTEDQKLNSLDIPYVLLKKWPKLEELVRENAVDFRACAGKSCPYVRHCSYVQDLRAAGEANIIVGNHSLMFRWPKGIPRPEHIIVDEAHRLEEEATKSFALEISGPELEGFLYQLENFQGFGALFYLLNEEGQSEESIQAIKTDVTSLTHILKEHLENLPTYLESYFKKQPRYTSEYDNELAMMEEDCQDPTGLKIRHLMESLYHLYNRLTQIMLPYSERFKPIPGEEHKVQAISKWEAFSSKCFDYEKVLEVMLSKEDTGYVKSLIWNESKGFKMGCFPVDVGKVLHTQLLSGTSSVVYTSATLGNEKGPNLGTEWAMGYTYTEGERRFKKGFFLPAQFDYEQQTKVFLATDTPHIHDQDFVPETLSSVLPLIRNLGGRSLLLFSSRKRFEQAVEYTLEQVTGELDVFIQGMGLQVVEEFKASSNAILIGMESFGEGIDIPGEGLQFLFIDKVPDVRQDRVVNERREFFNQKLGNEFEEYYLAKRTRALHQKLGRLIRREDDFGGALIVDSRLKRWKGRTISKMLNMMKPYHLEIAPVEEACLKIEEFIRDKSDSFKSADSNHHQKDCLDT